jgi:flagellar motor switch protein FliM
MEKTRTPDDLMAMLEEMLEELGQGFNRIYELEQEVARFKDQVKASRSQLQEELEVMQELRGAIERLRGQVADKMDNQQRKEILELVDFTRVGCR